MKKPLYYFTIDLVIEEHGLTNYVEIVNKVYEEFGEVFTIKQLCKYLGKPKKNSNSITMKEIFG
jgi:hypothetical protein